MSARFLRDRQPDRRRAGRPEAEGDAQDRDQKAASVLRVNEALASWFLFLGFGGFFLILYYCRIGYAPELEWEKSLTFLAAISLLGGGITAVYGLALMIPGIIWSEFLIFDQFLRQRFCYEGPDGREPCFQSLLQKLVFPFAVFMAAVHAAALLQQASIVILTAIAGLIKLCQYSFHAFQTEIREVRKVKDLSVADRRMKMFLEKNESTCLYKYTATAGVAGLAGLTSFLIIYTIVSPSAESAALLFICTFSLVVSNLLVAVQFRQKPVRAFVTGVVATLILLIAGEILAGDKEALSVRVVDQFGIGRLGKENSVTIVVSKAGREMLVKNHVKNISPLTGECEVSTPENPPACSAAIENAKILSSLGDEYLLEVEARRVVIPKSMVLSWSKIQLEENRRKQAPLCPNQ